MENRMACNRSSSRCARALVLCGALCLPLATVATFGAGIIAPSTAAAQDGEPGGIKDASPKDRPQMVSAFMGFQLNRFISYGFPFMISGRYYFPIVPDGFLPNINDEFGIEGGLDLLFLFGDATHFGFGIPVDAVWDFHFS